VTVDRSVERLDKRAVKKVIVFGAGLVAAPVTCLLEHGYR
jgi:hypothetical protein